MHVLDDGFQHFDLMRDIDLLVSPDAAEDTRTLPFGRLSRAARRRVGSGCVVGRREGVRESPTSSAMPSAWRSARFHILAPAGRPASDRPAFAFAGIAKPERFFGDLEKAGWKLTGRRSFGDHHHYSESRDRRDRARGDIVWRCR